MRAPSRAKRVAVELIAQLFFEVSQWIEGGGRGPDQGQPFVEWQLVAVLAIDTLPDLEAWLLGLHQEAIEIEDETFDHPIHSTGDPQS